MYFLCSISLSESCALKSVQVLGKPFQTTSKKSRSRFKQQAVLIFIGGQHELLLIVQTLGIVDFLRDLDGKALTLYMDLWRGVLQHCNTDFLNYVYSHNSRLIMLHIFSWIDLKADYYLTGRDCGQVGEQHSLRSHPSGWKCLWRFSITVSNTQRLLQSWC